MVKHLDDLNVPLKSFVNWISKKSSGDIGPTFSTHFLTQLNNGFM